MRLTVLGGCGAWPAAGQACGGYDPDAAAAAARRGYAGEIAVAAGGIIIDLDPRRAGRPEDRPAPAR